MVYDAACGALCLAACPATRLMITTHHHAWDLEAMNADIHTVDHAEKERATSYSEEFKLPLMLLTSLQIQV